MVLERQRDVALDAAPRQEGKILEDEGEGVEAVGRRPPTMASSVDFPQPDGPTTTTISPAATRRSMPASTGKAP
jgi:hypothetical protein